MRFGHRNLAMEASTLSQQHPMQNRLEKWDETRDNLRLTMERRMFGLGAPMRTLMERRVVEYVSFANQMRDRGECLLIVWLFYSEPTLSRSASDSNGWTLQGSFRSASRHTKRKR